MIQADALPRPGRGVKERAVREAEDRIAPLLGRSGRVPVADPHSIMYQQATAGNRAVARLLGQRSATVVQRAAKAAKVEEEDPAHPIPHAPRPSDPGTQMAALISSGMAGGFTTRGKCYAGIKAIIKRAGGYGDILDIFEDKRFLPQTWALQFSTVVDRLGPEALGLADAGGPESAAPGMLLVLYGGIMGIDKPYGDISVIAEVTKDSLVCYNDHRCDFPKSGVKKVFRALYQPIARPALTPEAAPAAVAASERPPS